MCWYRKRLYTSWYLSIKHFLVMLGCKCKIQKFTWWRTWILYKWLQMSNSFKMSLCLSPTVRAQLYHAGTDAQLDANGKRQPVFPAAHGQFHHAVLCEANIHSNALHEWRNSHQVSVDYQWNPEDQDTVRHLRQCQHQRHWQGTHAVQRCDAVTASPCFIYLRASALFWFYYN